MRRFRLCRTASASDESDALNNLAFAQVSVGDLPDALVTLREARSLVGTVDELLVLAATEALFMFRVGQDDIGRSRYRAVIGAFGRRQSREQAAKGALMLAREELVAEGEGADAAWKKADQMSRDCRRPDVRNLHAAVEGLFRDARDVVVNRPRLLSTEVKALASPLIIDPRVLGAEE
jgi:hypothetical protein